MKVTIKKEKKSMYFVYLNDAPHICAQGTSPDDAMTNLGYVCDLLNQPKNERFSLRKIMFGSIVDFRSLTMML